MVIPILYYLMRMTLKGVGLIGMMMMLETIHQYTIYGTGIARRVTLSLVKSFPINFLFHLSLNLSIGFLTVWRHGLSFVLVPTLLI